MSTLKMTSAWLALCALGCQLDAQLSTVERSDPTDENMEEEQDTDPSEKPADDDPPPEPPAELATFKDDFERADGAVMAPWKDAGQGAPSIFRGQLCVGSKETVSLALPKGRYGYVRADVVGGEGLDWALDGDAGELFSLHWYEGYGSQRQITGSSGEEIDGYTSMQVRSLEILLDYAAQKARVRSQGGPWVNAELGHESPGGIVSMRFASTYVEPQYGYGRTVCFDNVYASATQPSADPFADSPPVRVGYYTESESELCLLERCGAQMIACLDSACESEDDCSCSNDYWILQQCLDRDTSGTMQQCRMRAQGFVSESLVTKELMECADTYCATDVVNTPIVPDTGYGMSESDPLPSPTVVLTAVSRGDDIATVEIDLATGEQRQIGVTLLDPVSGSVEPLLVRLPTTANHEWRALHTIDAAGSQRIFTHRSDTWAELIFQVPIVSAQFFPNRHWIWVESAKSPTDEQRIRQLVGMLGGAFFRRTDTAGPYDSVTLHGPSEDSEAYAVVNSKEGPSAVVISRGVVADLTPGVGNAWAVIATFEDSVVFRHLTTGYVRWMSLKNEPMPEPLPEGSVRGAYLFGTSDLWTLTGESPTRVATTPSGTDAHLYLPVASDLERVLYQTPTGWLFTDTEGNRVGEVLPEPLLDGGESAKPVRAIPIGATCGLLLSGPGEVNGTGSVALDAFHFGATGELVVERVDTLGMPAQDARIAVRRQGLLAWQHGTELRGYDCNAFKAYTVVPSEPVLALGEYSPLSAHLLPEPPEEPVEDEDWE